MVTHIVAFKLNDRSREHLTECKAMLDALVGVVPSLRSMLVGVNVAESPHAHDLGLVATFDDLDGLEAYQVHPAHAEVGTYLRNNSEAIAVVDFAS